MKIKFTNFNDGIHHFDFIEKIGDLDLDEKFQRELRLSCKMDKSHHQIIINCDVDFETSLVCDRCTSKFNRPFSKQFQSIYFTIYESGKEVTEDPGVYYLSPTEDKIDLLNDVKEIMNLAIPMKVLCSEDCKGLCPNCGNNLNHVECNCENDVENPVWEPLKKLKGNLN